MLVLIDVSAAFDTIDHNILFNRLETKFGITGRALEWHRSYLSTRKQCVFLNGSVRSEECILKYGIPQGSCLGPILFSEYVSTLFDNMAARLVFKLSYIKNVDKCAPPHLNFL